MLPKVIGSKEITSLLSFGGISYVLRRLPSLGVPPDVSPTVVPSLRVRPPLPTFPSLSLSSVCLSVCLSVSVRLYLYPSLPLSLCLSVFVTVFVCLCLSVLLSFHGGLSFSSVRDKFVPVSLTCLPTSLLRVNFPFRWCLG